MSVSVVWWWGESDDSNIKSSSSSNKNSNSMSNSSKNSSRYSKNNSSNMPPVGEKFGWMGEGEAEGVQERYLGKHVAERAARLDVQAREGREGCRHTLFDFIPTAPPPPASPCDAARRGRANAASARCDGRCAPRPPHSTAQRGGKAGESGVLGGKAGESAVLWGESWVIRSIRGKRPRIRGARGKSGGIRG
eukprot:275067-Chlamydomonas_euryale.AAC.5